MTVRAGRPDDVSAMVALETESFGRDAWSEALVRALPGVLVAAEQVTGPVCAYAAWHLAGEVADLDRVVVTAAARRTGVATALLHAVLTAAADRGAARLMLEVRADNAPALALYAAAGMSEVDRRRRYYADGTDALVMGTDLGASAP